MLKINGADSITGADVQGENLLFVPHAIQDKVFPHEVNDVTIIQLRHELVDLYWSRA